MALSDWELALIETQRVAHLATIGEDNQPSVLPVVYAFDGERFLIPLDRKPKRVDVRQLRRVRDIAANPQVALVIDKYDEDWSQLAWLQIRGMAVLLESGATYEQALPLLENRYPQYLAMPLVDRPLIAITPIEIRNWRWP
ncbi:MAG: TIGR03668 family PPOX class F420-dependent oxidoreductase [Roseiflexaceae bacterium]|nr:TIGR03668 family PPOX class F420-dependent oxidoreductase [Roseiflexaceae bacterium]